MQFIGFGKIGFEFEKAWITVLRGFFMCFGLVGLTVTIFESCCGFVCVSYSENG
jgi:hypothetical protein